jgi:hypothetical protein
VKRFVAALLGGMGIAALLRRRRRKVVPVAPATDSLAEELRAKLAESRAAEAEAETGARIEPSLEETELEARRRQVHERARSSIDELGNTS